MTLRNDASTMDSTTSDLSLRDLRQVGQAPGPDVDVMRSRIADRMFGVARGPVMLGRFELRERIGAGGMGVVCTAFDPSLGRTVAIKVLSSERLGSEGGRRLVEEAKTLAQLSHPNVVTVHEVAKTEGNIFIVMEYVEGATLEVWQRDRRNIDEVLSLYRQAAAGLAAAHAVGIVHRDFKPSNVLVGSDGRVRVADFGLARASVSHPTASSGTTSTGTEHVGTPAYMSPEQAAGRPTNAKSDQFSFCLCLWEAVYGCRPYSADEIRRLATAADKVDDPAGGARRAPRWLRRALLRGLDPDPDPDGRLWRSSTRSSSGRLAGCDAGASARCRSRRPPAWRGSSSRVPMRVHHPIRCWPGSGTRRPAPTCSGRSCKPSFPSRRRAGNPPLRDSMPTSLHGRRQSSTRARRVEREVTTRAPASR